MIAESSTITDTFKCPNPIYRANNIKLSYRTCILRQSAIQTYQGQKFPLYPDCAECEHGKAIRDRFGDVRSDHKASKKFTKPTVKSNRWKRKNGGSAYTSHFDADIARVGYE